MRQYLANNASEEMFKDQRIMYQNFINVIKSPQSTPEEKSNAKDLIRDYLFLQNIVTFEDYKQSIKKSSFWADQWAIGLIEKYLHIKIIILDNDTQDINCGVPTDLEESDIPYIPKGYIIVEHIGLHYRLVSYNGNTFFKNISQMPKSIIRLLKEKRPPQNQSCVQVGLYRYIPELNPQKNYKSKGKSGYGKMTKKKK